jgi:hypothetical protein
MATSGDPSEGPPGPRQGLALLAVLALPVVVAALLYATWRPVDTTLGQYLLSGFVAGAGLVGVALAAIPRVRRRVEERRDQPDDQR